jgi:hypothetical protein
MEVALSVLKTVTGSQRDISPLATDDTYSSVIDPALTILRAEAYEYHQEYVSKSPNFTKSPL